MEVKPATRNKLGAVIIGEGFEITEEGTLSVNKNFTECDEFVEFTRERLDELFTISRARRR